MIVYQDNTDLNNLKIIDNNNIRSLCFGNNIKQSSIDKLNPHNLVIPYTRSMMSSLIFIPEPEKVLIIGLGGGGMVTFLSHHFKNCHIHAIESSPKIIKIAEKYFLLPDSPLINILSVRGEKFLKTASESKYSNYQIIYVDAFNSDGMASLMKSYSFYEDCFSRLIDNGIMVANIWSKNKGPHKKAYTAIKDNFPYIIKLPVKDRGNIVILAFKQDIIFKKLIGFKNRMAKMENKYNLDFEEYISFIIKYNFPFLQRFKLRMG
jgi:spermidine synthase